MGKTYIGNSNGKAVKPKKIYIGYTGSVTIPGGTTSTTTTKDITNSLSSYFTITQGGGYDGSFPKNGNYYVSDIYGQSSSTAYLGLTAKTAITGLSFDCIVSSEARYDTLSIQYNGSEVKNMSGTETYTWSGNVKSGDYFRFYYEKDGSMDDYDDCGKVGNFKATVTETTTIPDTTVTYNNTARLVKKIYLGVNGVAKLVYSLAAWVLGAAVKTTTQTGQTGSITGSKTYTFNEDTGAITLGSTSSYSMSSLLSSKEPVYTNVSGKTLTYKLVTNSSTSTSSAHYTEGSSSSTSSWYDRGYYLSGKSSYSFNSSTGQYTVSGSRSGYVEDLYNNGNKIYISGGSSLKWYEVDDYSTSTTTSGGGESWGSWYQVFYADWFDNESYDISGAYSSCSVVNGQFVLSGYIGNFTIYGDADEDIANGYYPSTCYTGGGSSVTEYSLYGYSNGTRIDARQGSISSGTTTTTYTYRVRTYTQGSTYHAGGTTTTYTVETYTQTATSNGGSSSGTLDPVFANNTWSQIIEACDTNTVPETWSIGDSKVMNIGGTDYQIDIIGKKSNMLESGFAAPLTFQFHDCYNTKYAMHNTAATGYYNSNMRTTHLPTILAAMPTEVQNAISPVLAVTINSDGSSTDIPFDKLFLLSEYEIFGSTDKTGHLEGIGQYEYYKNGGSTIKYLNGTSQTWWGRSSMKSSWSTNSLFLAVMGEDEYGASSMGGTVGGKNAVIEQVTYGAAPAFCFGCNNATNINLISFTIQLDSYSTSDRPTIQLVAEEGMTLYDWVNSSYFAPLSLYGYSLYSGPTPTGTFGLNNTKISFYLMMTLVGNSTSLKSNHVLTDGGSYRLI